VIFGEQTRLLRVIDKKKGDTLLYFSIGVFEKHIAELLTRGRNWNTGLTI